MKCVYCIALLYVLAGRPVYDRAGYALEALVLNRLILFRAKAANPIRTVRSKCKVVESVTNKERHLCTCERGRGCRSMRADMFLIAYATRFVRREVFSSLFFSENCAA